MACLCDASSLTCSVQYKLGQNQTGDDVPVLYRALSSRQIRLPSNDSSRYWPFFVCDVVNLRPGDDISCDRQPANVQTCESTVKCQFYTVNFTSEQCGLQCSEIAWRSPYIAPMTNSGFEHLAFISENGACFPRNNTVKDMNSGTELSLAVGIGISCGALVVIAVLVTTWIICKRIRTRGKSNDVCEPKASSTEYFSDSQNRGLEDERDEDQYHEIDDINVGVRSPEHFDEFDNEGYNMVGDEAATVHIDKKTRPLPFPPDDQDISPGESLPSTDATSSLELSAVPRQNSSGVISSYPRSLTVSAPSNVPSIESSNTATDSIYTESLSFPSASSTAVLISPGKLTSDPAPGVNKGSTTHALPSSPSQASSVPHKIPYSPAQYDYLGLVNIRSGHPSLSNQSQLKLVRKKDGNMELVTMQDDLPALENLCSGFQLIGLRNGSLCVLGLVAEAPGDDYHKYFKILKLHSDRCPHIDTSSYNNPTSTLKPDGDEKGPKQAIYLGQLELESDHSVRSTESGGYLKVIDLATAEDCSENGGYLRVLDIEEANITDKDGEYLTVLDF